LPAFFDRNLESFLIEHNVEISAVPIQQGGLWTTILYFGPALLLIGFYVWMYRRAAQGAGMGMGSMFGIGRSQAKRYDAADAAHRVTFDDVAGIDEAEAELVEIVDFLKAPDKYTRLGGTAPKGVLLIGAPGTGKTLLARAVAGEAGVPFFSMSASEFVEMIVGVGAARVRDLFKQARESAPAIIFIDEIDAIGRARGQVAIGGHSEQEQTLQQILTEMDGFSGREGIIVLAATNAPDVLDRALLRPGRFDRRVVVNLPDKVGREAILRVHVRKVPLAPDAQLEELAQATPGFSGADLRNLVNEAALLAARREENAVTHKDLLDALEKIVLGPERPLLLSAEDRERIAYHESGHAILGLVVAGADPVHRVSIVPRGQALGVTYQRPQTDRYNYPEAYLRARIIGMLGGRAAEEVVYGTRTTGAESDIEQAHAARAQHGDAMGHERGRRDGAAGTAREPLPRRRWLRRRQAVQREDRGPGRCRSAAHHQRLPRRGQAPAAAAPRCAGRSRRRAPQARDAVGRRDPAGHRPAARAAAGRKAAAYRLRPAPLGAALDPTCLGTGLWHTRLASVLCAGAVRVALRDDLAEFSADEHHLRDDVQPHHGDQHASERAVSAESPPKANAEQRKQLEAEQPGAAAQRGGQPHVTPLQPDRRQVAEQEGEREGRQDQQRRDGKEHPCRLTEPWQATRAQGHPVHCTVEQERQQQQRAARQQ
jgi:ATP-dependent metalloprotease FtsH